MTETRPDFEAEPQFPFMVPTDEEGTPVSVQGMLDRLNAAPQQQQPEPQEEETEEEEFDPAIAEDVFGLMHLGRLTGRFEILGHSFVLKTLTVGEELAVGQIMNEYAGTVVHGQASATAMVAASLVTVDGRELLAPLGPGQETSIRQRFDYISERWYPTTVFEVYRRYEELQGRQARAYEAVQSKSLASRTTSTP